MEHTNELSRWIPCPKCGGNIISKNTKKGKVFFGCDNFPKCNYALWDEPTGDVCPDCNLLLVSKKGKVYCPNCISEEK